MTAHQSNTLYFNQRGVFMKLDMIGLTVKNMERALAFYELLGLHCVYGDASSHYTEIGNEAIRISLNTEALSEMVMNQTFQKDSVKCELAFLCDSQAALDLQIETLRKHDIAIIKEPFLAPWGQYYAVVSDFDGHMISLFIHQ